MDILKNYLNDKIDILYKNTKKIDNNKKLLQNKLFEKKIEYMNNYLHNSIIEIEEINNFKLEEYKNMESSINNYVVHNL